MRIKILCEENPIILRSEKLILIINRNLLIKRELSAEFIINYFTPFSLAGLINLLIYNLNIGPFVMIGEEKRNLRIKAAKYFLF
jgi:hypothetical protein